MFVTSDIFDLVRIGRYRGVNWSEHLLCGVDLHGPVWPGPAAVAAFIVTAARRCGLFEAMHLASYDLQGETRSRPITPKSFEKIARGELRGAKDARGLMIKGYRPAAGTTLGRIEFGAVAWSQNEISWFSVNFVFPLDDDPFGRANEFLRLGAEMMGAEYGYLYIRDEFCFPQAYAWGMSAPLDHSKLDYLDACESGDWSNYVRRNPEEGLWSGRRPKLRDLFQLNLLSARRLSEPVEGLGLLSDWIAAQPGRGRLEDLGQGRVLWTLSDQEMVDVRPVLNAAGLLLSCRERMYRDLRGGFSPAERGWPPIQVFSRLPAEPRHEPKVN